MTNHHVANGLTVAIGAAGLMTPQEAVSLKWQVIGGVLVMVVGRLAWELMGHARKVIIVVIERLSTDPHKGRKPRGRMKSKPPEE